MTEMFGEAWPPMSAPDLAPDDDDDTGKNLNLTTKIELLYRNHYRIQSQKNLNFESGYLNFTKFQEKKSE